MSYEQIPPRNQEVEKWQSSKSNFRNHFEKIGPIGLLAAGVLAVDAYIVVAHVTGDPAWTLTLIENGFDKFQQLVSINSPVIDPQG